MATINGGNKFLNATQIEKWIIYGSSDIPPPQNDILENIVRQYIRGTARY